MAQTRNEIKLNTAALLARLDKNNLASLYRIYDHLSKIEKNQACRKNGALSAKIITGSVICILAYLTYIIIDARLNEAPIKNYNKFHLSKTGTTCGAMFPNGYEEFNNLCSNYKCCTQHTFTTPITAQYKFDSYQHIDTQSSGETCCQEATNYKRNETKGMMSFLYHIMPIIAILSAKDYIYWGSLVIASLGVKHNLHDVSTISQADLITAQQIYNLNLTPASTIPQTIRIIEKTLQSHENDKEMVNDLRFSFVVRGKNNNSTVPNNLPKEMEHKILYFAGLFAQPPAEKDTSTIELKNKISIL